MEEKKVGTERELKEKSHQPREMADLGNLIPELIYISLWGERGQRFWDSIFSIV